MAPNGSSRKTPAPATANGKPSSFTLVPKSLLDTTYSLTDKATKPKLRDDVSKRLPKASKAGSWDPDNLKKEPTSPSATQQTLVSRLSPETAKAFTTGRPMADRPYVVKCNHCKRALLAKSAKAHIEDCIAKKQEKQRRKKEAKDARDADRRRAERGGGDSESEDDDDTVIGLPGSTKTARKSEIGVDGGVVGGKKRKAEDDVGGKKKKKKGEEANLPKTKAPRPKAPVDVEKQCGVELPQGGQCARSLTCKSHSMGAKRAVPGRSAPYDKLLVEYQRKNQAKLQKAALESQPLLPDDDLAPTGPVDSDEEKDLVLAAIARSRPQPLFQPQLVPLRRKHQYVRFKQMLGNALGGREGRGLFGTSVA